MKERQLRQHTTCSLCRQQIGQTGLPMFWTVRLERHGLQLDAIFRQTGLAMLLGGHAGLAQVMGPDEEMTIDLGSWTLTVCETCACERDLPIAALALDIAETSTHTESEENHD